EIRTTSSYAYDNWGELWQTTNPDGTRTCRTLDPIGSLQSAGPILREWPVSAGGSQGGLTETWLNRFGEPALMQRFDASGGAVGIHRYFHDGLGRLAAEIDARDLRTEYRYDVFNRATETVLPEGTVVRRGYAEHSNDDLPVLIAIDGIVLGSQQFDGIGRLAGTCEGTRRRSFEYAPDMLRPAKMTTPAGHVVEYDYRPELGEEPVKRRVSGKAAEYAYDQRDAALVACEEGGLDIRRTYSATGQLSSETRRQGGQDHAVRYEYSRQGRLLSFTDVAGRVETHTYDRTGKLEAFLGPSIGARFSYDDFGRLACVLTEDRRSGRTLETAIAYDDLGRETSRHFVHGGIERELIRTYNGDDSLAAQTLTENGSIVRAETFSYDARGRLEIYRCTGSTPPIDAYGRAIEQQVFVFDALDNIVRVRTRAPDGSTNIAIHEHAPDDRVVLRRITNDHPDYPPEIVFEYDGDGNLLNDQRGFGLEYDALGRLTKIVPENEGEGHTYQYDALDTLVGDSDGAQSEQRFYCEDKVANRIRGGSHTHYFCVGGILLGEERDGTVLLHAVDVKNTVLFEFGLAGTVGFTYTAYGHRQEAESPARIGYNGELHEGKTGWQMLGSGYRAYDPVMMRFHAPDNLSPFDAGGINAYAYCAGDPANFADPSGHNPFAVTFLLSTVLAIGLGIGASQTEGTIKTILTIGAAVAGLAALASGATAAGYSALKRSSYTPGGATRAVTRPATGSEGSRPYHSGRRGGAANIGNPPPNEGGSEDWILGPARSSASAPQVRPGSSQNASPQPASSGTAAERRNRGANRPASSELASGVKRQISKRASSNRQRSASPEETTQPPPPPPRPGEWRNIPGSVRALDGESTRLAEAKNSLSLTAKTQLVRETRF
ncbi:RHS repeat-associated core domain-containing protein, partial [Mesorhizobium retamae]